MDPLASNKGFWAEILGVGDFYYELAVQIVEICLATRSVNGGLMALPVSTYDVKNGHKTAGTGRIYVCRIYIQVELGFRGLCDMVA